MADKTTLAKTDFRQLLRETKIITHKSKEEVSENVQHLKEILAVLENDSRYLVLNDMPDERERILETHLNDMASKVRLID